MLDSFTFLSIVLATTICFNCNNELIYLTNQLTWHCKNIKKNVIFIYFSLTDLLFIDEQRIPNAHDQFRKHDKYKNETNVPWSLLVDTQEKQYTDTQ